MPTDFVMRWLVYFGRLALLWGGVEPPPDEDKQKLYLAPVGVVCIMSAGMLFLAGMVLLPDLPTAIAGVIKGSTDGNWSNGILAVIWAGVLVMVSPGLVGSFYSRRLRSVRSYPFATVGVLFVTMIVGAVLAGRAPSVLKATLVLTPIESIPIIVMFCPRLPPAPANKGVSHVG